MKTKILFSLIIILSLISISAVCAEDNATVIDDINNGVGDVPPVATNVSSDDSVGGQDSSSDANVSDDGSSSVEENQTVIQNSKISASNVVGYEKFSTGVVVKLTADDQPLAGKNINITLNDVLYKKITDSKGQVTLNVKLTKGTYYASFSYAGDENTSACNGTSKVTVNYGGKIADYDVTINAIELTSITI